MSKSKRLIWHIFPYQVLIILVTFFAVAMYTAASFRNYYEESTRADLVSKAVLFSHLLSPNVMTDNPARVDSLCKQEGALLPYRFTVILPDGRVIGDSQANPASMENHSDRPEVRQAMLGKNGVSIRFSFTLRENMVYAAVPLRSGGNIEGVVRVSFPSTIMNRTLSAFYIHLSIGGFVLILLALLFSIALSLRFTGTFREILKGAALFSEGDLQHRLRVRSFAEIDTLANAMNGMADQLYQRIQTITRQRNELEAVLSSMREAVIAIDLDERLINCNHAAEALFGFSLASARGRTIQEIVRNSQLQGFLKKVLSGVDSLKEDTILHFPPDRYLQAHGSLLRDSMSQSIGALFVLNDITRLKTLENIRRDFVANVSHELKTPITSIKGFVETLRDGAMDNQETARRFLDIIMKHTERLNSIIEDLLSLSRIEQEAENEAIRFDTAGATEILKNVIMICDGKIREKNITVRVSCEENITVTGNTALLEQALSNLLDNAIKYSNPGSEVLIEASRGDKEISIRVEDYGVGIPEKDLPRIFERFYRVDKARSRDMGGTGLGLAIVKHIIQAHNGRVTVTSALGKGSVFTLHLPAIE